MLRGFRWQLALFGVAALLLAGAILLRPQLIGPSPVTSTPLPGASASNATSAVPAPLPPAEIAAPVVFREGLVGRLQRLNPLLVDLNPVDRDIAGLIFEGLVGTNAYGEYLPLLAQDWTITRDGLEYVFRLRQDVLWQDGVPFTAADVATTIALLQAPGSVIADSLQTFWRTVEIELLDEYTVRFRLAQPLASFLDHLRIGVLPAHVFNGIAPEQLAGHPFNLSPIGTGPYQLERLIAGEDGVAAVALRVAPVYRQRPEGQGGYALERIVFHLYPTPEAALEALRAGEIDALGNVDGQAAAALEQAGAVRTHIGVQPIIGAVLFNWENERTRVFREQRVRRALVMSADRAGLVNRHLSGKAIPADSPFIPGSWAHAGTVIWPAYDPAQAASLLANIDFALPIPTPAPTAEGQETAPPAPTPMPGFTFTLLCPDDPALVALAEDLAAQWALLGIHVTTEAVPADTLRTRLESGQFDAALVELDMSGSADPDPYRLWHQGQYGPGQNYSGINDRRTSELLELARRDPNGLHRAEYYAAFQQMFADRALAMLLYYPVYQYVTTTQLDGVQIGFLSSPTDRFRNLQEWTLR